MPTAASEGCSTAATMVVLTEEFHGLTLKRKGADEPELFDACSGDDRSSSAFPISCRATKMRRLACPDAVGGPPHQDAPAAWGGVTAAGQDDVPMCDEPAAASAGSEERSALVLYGGGGGRSDAATAGRLALRDGAGWVRAMLREADSRTVRQLLAGAGQEHGSDGLALAVVPWVPPPSPEEDEAEPSTAAEEANGDDDDDGAAAMDVEEEAEAPARSSIGQAHGYGYGNGAGEGFVYRWPQHCMAPPQMPAVAQPSPVMWSW